MQVLFYIPLLILGSFFPHHVFTQKNTGNGPAAKWVLTKGCSLKVAGSTNVNKFTCDISDYSTPDTLLVYHPTGEQHFPVRGALHLDINKFNCHNPMMTNDLLKTLKGKQFPKMVVQFVSLSKLPDFTTPNNIITGVVNIELSGAKKSYVVNYTFKKDATNTIYLVGKRQVLFSDFNLTPPRKLGGMIRTREELEVEFRLTMKSLL